MTLQVDRNRPIRHAVASCGVEGAALELIAPATPEAVLRAIANARGAVSRNVIAPVVEVPL